MLLAKKGRQEVRLGISVMDGDTFVYHERQDSSLCGQHALNTLLQGAYFTAPDLAGKENMVTTLTSGSRLSVKHSEW